MEGGLDDDAGLLPEMHDHVLLEIFSFLEPAALLAGSSIVCSVWRKIAHDDTLWLEHCRRRWATKASRFHLSKRRKAVLEAGGPGSWMKAYRVAEENGSRSSIMRLELTSLAFQYYLPEQPSILASPDHFRFCCDGLTLGHPLGCRFPWVLDDDGVGIQWGPPFAFFPKGLLSRRLDWSWRIESSTELLGEVDVGEAAYTDDGNGVRTIDHGGNVAAGVWLGWALSLLLEGGEALELARAGASRLR
eukprot:gnl/TRDRNA2_/TRDRNA2_44139_c0_seq2.p1 gnl/TRDRNA2_/TRDRNA2_44139_c0~~gnl/TRDRNA2_/TRDRNA2_44139_c0_seq2.p1  ORF type:complete len:246 (+),score=34.95 gnl/TRDRNA2_/TRDRNA2_44139_c0_seq2:78-815(+)